MSAATAPPRPPAAPDDEVPGGAGRSLGRLAFLVASVGIVLLGALLVPMPVVEIAPGHVTPVADLLEVDGRPAEADGIGLVAVRVDRPSLLELGRALVDDDRVLRDVDEVVPPAMDQRTYLELQQEAFRRAFGVAAAVGLRSAGYDVGISTAAQVAGVVPDGPADGLLQVGDVVRTVDGAPVDHPDELVSRVRRASVGDALTVEVERGGRRVEVTIETGRVPGLDHAAMGITLQTLEEEVDLPVPVELVDQRDIGGPSAGLVVALAVHDAVTDADLARGRQVVATGTVDAGGRVGRVGSVREKAVTASARGADLLLVPDTQVAEARSGASGGLEVVGVASVEEAVEVLRR